MFYLKYLGVDGSIILKYTSNNRIWSGRMDSSVKV